MLREELFQSAVLFDDGVLLTGGLRKDLFETEDFLFEGFDVHFFSFAVRSAEKVSKTHCHVERRLTSELVCSILVVSSMLACCLALDLDALEFGHLMAC